MRRGNQNHIYITRLTYTYNSQYSLERQYLLFMYQLAFTWTDCVTFSNWILPVNNKTSYQYKWEVWIMKLFIVMIQDILLFGRSQVKDAKGTIPKMYNFKNQESKYFIQFTYAYIPK
jgi:hypothetical protein